MSNEEQENIGEIPQSPVQIHKQYLKDMSFENPNAPEILKIADSRPEMEMNLSMNLRKLEEEKIEHFYEVTLTVNASAKRGDKTMFVAEIVYGAAVSIHGLEENKHHPILLTEVPYMMFPFVRQILANATQAGGFTALQLGIVDFRTMYLKRFGNKQDDQKNDNESA